MHNHGFLRVAAAVPTLRVADVAFNVDEHLKLLAQAETAGVRLVVFPECSLTGYTCGDLFHQDALLTAAAEGLRELAKRVNQVYYGVAIVGLPFKTEGMVFNVAASISTDGIVGITPKTYLPNYKEFYDARYFTAGTRMPDGGWMVDDRGQREWVRKIDTFRFGDATIGVEICEDLWMPSAPSNRMALAGANVIVNLSASNETIGKANYRRQLVVNQSAKCIAAYIYTSSGIGESTTDLVFGGHAIIAENGVILKESQRFQKHAQLVVTDIDLQHLEHDRLVANTFNWNRHEAGAIETVHDNHPRVTPQLERVIDPHPFVPGDTATLRERCEEIFHIQTAALGRRLEHVGLPTVSIGVSGGLDSTLALLVLVKTADAIGMPRNRIRGLTMPGFGTTERTKKNAWTLMNNLGLSGSEIDIRGQCFEQMKALGHAPFGIALEGESLQTFTALLQSLHVDNRKDLTFENVQARVRTSLLMNAGFSIGTGDLSELCLGWCTYNADHMSMYNPNVSIPKTLVKFLVKWAAEHEFDGEVRTTLLDIFATEISPELLPIAPNGAIQSTEGTIGPYELHDFFIYHMLRWGSAPDKILYLASQTKFDMPYTSADIKKWLIVFLKRFFNNQFKRSCLPDGPKVGTVSVSPRGDWRMPSDASVNAWLATLDSP